MSEELFNKLYKHIHYFKKKYPSIDSVDIEEEMLWSIAKAYATYDESRGVKLDTYVCHIMHNRCKMHLRDDKKKVHNNAISLDDVAYKDEKTILYDILSVEPSEDNDYAYILNDLINFKASLPKSQSRILELYLKGYTNKEMTEKLKTTHNNISLQRTMVAEKFIKQYLEEYPILREHKVIKTILNRWERKSNGKRDFEKVPS